MQVKRLQSGQLAPVFRVKDWQDKVIELQYPLQTRVLLCFFRYASCPLCNLRVQELIKENQRLRSCGISILAVFQSPPERIQHYVGQQEPPFPLIPDPKRELYRLYAVESSWTGFLRAWTVGITKVFRAVFGQGFLPGTVEGELHRIPADFLIDVEGHLVEVYYGKDIGDHLPLANLFNHAEITKYERRKTTHPREDY